MSPRRGFTLLEMMVALVLAAVVALLVYGSMRTGTDTSERLDRYRRTAEADAQVRALIADALRHPPEVELSDDTMFVLDRAADERGLRMDRVRFLSRGVIPPLGTSVVWSVSLAPTANGITLHAAPRDQPGAIPVTATLPHVRGLAVRTLHLGDTLWTDEWNSPNRTPDAVELRFLSASGALSGPPLLVAIGVGGAR